MPKLPVHVVRRKDSPNLYWMRDIPEHARFLFRTERGLRKQIWKSLRTTNPKIAAVRAAEYNGWFETILSKVTDPKLKMPSLTGADGGTLVIDVVDDDVWKVKDGDLVELNEEDWRNYELGEYVYATPENNLVRNLSQTDAIAFFKFGMLETALEDSKFLVGNYDVDIETLGNIIEQCRRTIHNNKCSSDPNKRLAYLQAELDLEIAHQTLTRMEGRREHLSKEYSDESIERVLDKIIDTQNKITIGEKVTEYLNDPLSKKSGRHKSTSTARIGTFVEFVGPKTPLESIGKQDILNYRKRILDLLPKRPAYGAKTLEQKIAPVKNGVAEPLSVKTKNLYLNALSAFFNWCLKMDYIQKNPVLPFRYPTEKKKRKERRAFTTKELQALFGDEWRSFKETEPHHYWIPLIALFHGCRLREICQLRQKDIFYEDGILGLHITGDDDLGTSVKNASSDRRIPIHKTVVDLGFDECCKKVPKGKKLFPQLPDREDGAPSFGKWFKRYKEQSGINDPNIDFHSFRHTYREACRENGLPYDVLNRIAGWKLGESPEAAYGNANFKRLYEELSRLCYSGLGLPD